MLIKEKINIKEKFNIEFTLHRYYDYDVYLFYFDYNSIKFSFKNKENSKLEIYELDLTNHEYKLIYDFGDNSEDSFDNFDFNSRYIFYNDIIFDLFTNKTINLANYLNIEGNEVIFFDQNNLNYLSISNLDFDKIGEIKKDNSIYINHYIEDENLNKLCNFNGFNFYCLYKNLFTIYYKSSKSKELLKINIESLSIDKNLQIKSYYDDDGSEIIDFNFIHITPDGKNILILPNSIDELNMNTFLSIYDLEKEELVKEIYENYSDFIIYHDSISCAGCDAKDLDHRVFFDKKQKYLIINWGRNLLLYDYNSFKRIAIYQDINSVSLSPDDKYLCGYDIRENCFKIFELP
jgi:hypothetical protein